MGGLSLLYFLRLRGRPAARQDAVQHTYLKFCAKLNRIGLARMPSQGPLDFTKMVIAVHNDLQTAVTDIAKLYIDLRYAGSGNKNDLKQFKILVRRFNP